MEAAQGTGVQASVKGACSPASGRAAASDLVCPARNEARGTRDTTQGPKQIKEQASPRQPDPRGFATP